MANYLAYYLTLMLNVYSNSNKTQYARIFPLTSPHGWLGVGACGWVISGAWPSTIKALTIPLDLSVLIGLSVSKLNLN
jgi:hypothetical protein